LSAKANSFERVKGVRSQHLTTGSKDDTNGKKLNWIYSQWLIIERVLEYIDRAKNLKKRLKEILNMLNVET